MSCNRRILCLDDGYGMIQSMANKMISGGYKVQVSESADQALNCYKRNSYDLVILGLNVPEVEDIEFLVNIRHVNPEQKVMVITVLPPHLPLWKMPDNRTEEKVLHMGLSSFLIRPFTLEKDLSGISGFPNSSLDNDRHKDNQSGILNDFYDALIFVYAVEGDDLTNRDNFPCSCENPDYDIGFVFFEIEPCNSSRKRFDFGN